MFLSFDTAIVRIRAWGGKPLGAGFLAVPNLVLTCWHVAEKALHEERLRLNFPTVAPGKPLTARLVVRGQGAEGRDYTEVAHETLIQRWG